MSARRGFLVTVLIAPLLIGPSGLAQQRATPGPSGKLVKFVILSRHGVRSPIPKQDELDSWTTNKSPWPTWYCPPPDGKVCIPGQLTPQGRNLAEQMGTYYGRRLSTLVSDQCPVTDHVFFWADRDDKTKRTKDTAIVLLQGFRPKSCDTARYLHEASAEPDRIFHPVGGDRCTLDPARAGTEIVFRAGGDFPTFIRREKLESELSIAQGSLQCCQSSLCQKLASCGRVQACVVPGLPTCLAPEVDKVPLGGGLRIASTFAELMLLEYANGFEPKDVGWGIDRDKMLQTSRLHTAAFDLEQRTPYIAKLQGSRLLNKILLALQGQSDGQSGTAPKNAKFVAYVGHDTNISNVAALLGLSWQQAGYQKVDRTRFLWTLPPQMVGWR